MLKKAFKLAVTFGLLLAAHIGYVRLFAIVARQVAPDRPRGITLVPTVSRTMKEAIGLAGKGFGHDHWSADPNLQVRYYNKERGYWMYAREYERLNDGKQVRLKPFAAIWESSDGKVLKTATSDEAIVDLDRPLGLAIKPGAPPMRVVHAQLTGDVHIRDDRGTADPGDDLVIGPMPYVEYDEPTLQIRSESNVVIQDRDMWINGFGLLIQLRPREEAGDGPGNGTGAGSSGSSTGFNGAKTAFLNKDVHIIINDVGRAGILPGTARPEQTEGGRTPLDLRCAGKMQIDLPRPRLPVRVGPPAPPEPTLAMFSRKVVVLRGKTNQTPDQLNCDHLRLVLRPAEKPPATAAPDRDPGEGGGQTQDQNRGKGTDQGDSLGGLTLRRAEATGSEVWLQSESQGTKARCNELIYKKLAPEAPDETYLRGDATTKLWVEKVDLVQDGPNRGKVQSITRIWTIDATIFDNGQGRDSATVVARGPGRLDTRPDRGAPAERTAYWQDSLTLRNIPGDDPAEAPRKQITLKGDPKVLDPVQGNLDAHDEIVVWLKPRPSDAPKPTTPPAVAPLAASETAPATGAAGSESEPASRSYQIETLRALDNVHLVTPGRNLTAANVLVAAFETIPTPAPATAPAVATPAPAPAPALAANPAPAAPTPAAEPKAPAKPAEPDVNVRADQVWARITLRPGAEQGGARNDVGNVTGASSGNGNGNAAGMGGTKSELQEVRLRGAVVVRQAPAPGKERGTTVSGDAVDVTNLGESKMYFKVFQVDPYKIFPSDPKVKILPGELLSRIESYGTAFPVARVETEEFSVEGPIIGLNQRTDEAWVDGRGILTQLAPRELLTDKGLDNPVAVTFQVPAQNQAQSPASQQPRPGTESNLVPMKISWTKAMKFQGRSTNPQGQPVARAQFFDNVRAEMEDALLLCQEMTTYMDRVIPLNRPRRDRPAAVGNTAEPAPAPEPKPQIALIDCLRKVLIISQKVDPETRRVLLQKQQIEGDHVTYDKLTGEFIVPGHGRAFLYNRDGQDSIATPATAPAPASAPPTTTANRRNILPTANPTTRGTPNVRRANEVISRGTGGAGTVKAQVKVKDKEKTGTRTETPPLAPLKLTQIVFNDEMHGRFGTGKASDTSAVRWADFFGDVQVLHGIVSNEKATFNYDSPPEDSTFLTAQTIRVVSEPPPPGSKDPARNLMKAWEDANVRTKDTTIQADKITYDSLKELFYAYGEEGRDVLIVQGNTGQPTSTGRGSSAWYNRRTGESAVDDPKSIQLVDNTQGIRSGHIYSLPEPKRLFKKPLTPVRPPSRSYYERKGFNGR